MALAKIYQPYTRLNHEELDGLLHILKNTTLELSDNGNTDALLYLGAFFALSILRYHEFVDFPDDFMRLLENLIAENFEE